MAPAIAPQPRPIAMQEKDPLSSRLKDVIESCRHSDLDDLMAAINSLEEKLVPVLIAPDPEPPQANGDSQPLPACSPLTLVARDTRTQLRAIVEHVHRINARIDL